VQVIIATKENNVRYNDHYKTKEMIKPWNIK
jgi:hypothetical protein